MYRLNTKIRLTMLCLSAFELSSRWVPVKYNTSSHPDDRILNTVSQHRKTQTTFDVLKFTLGSKAWGNKAKEIIPRLSNEQFISFVLFPKPRGQTSIGQFQVNSPRKNLCETIAQPQPATSATHWCPIHNVFYRRGRKDRRERVRSIKDLWITMPPKKSKETKVWCFLVLNVILIS